MKNQNSPEIIKIQDQNFGNHVEHWNLLTDTPETDVPKWLGLALDAPVMPMGLCQDEHEMDQSFWLIQGPSGEAVSINQIIAVEDQKPRALKTAFPSFDSPYKYDAQIERIITCDSSTQAVLRLNLNKNTIIYAFDNLFSVNSCQYDKNQTYQVQFNAWAYELETVSADEKIIVDDPASIKHHRALNAILTEHNGIAPDNLQELINDWQPKTPEDQEPVTVDFSKMVAYLFGETLGQEDEAWFQGNIVGKTSMQFMQEEYTLYDVTLVLEDDLPAILIRIATKNELYKNFNIGQYIRGNLWIQANIYAKTAHK
ncbi:hypothetical protein MMP66_01665 [Acinetobacter dispersus]|uniref:hypothetical protein n=1 Tax=Acinetobacter TaxID=469 RepID=UPI0002CF7ADA|nr:MULTISPECIES: hypothetical protein [Acinetobacter]ENX54967.1 hypothetical protein F901_02282 [Acinetobacter dispersus]ENX63393.1 hypothetical protein F885_00675 [Acinetobacter higginsii]MCH7317456.1 hypothetical protein [Acinetobacter higginsii]MCH7383787.1 hypothetical protein [Acinetobacter dispersus]MCH7389247.1 hypothetical protein [Acinetobacter dispersus]